MSNKLEQLRERGVIRDEVQVFLNLVYAEGLRQIQPGRVFIDVRRGERGGPYLQTSEADAKRLEAEGYQRVDISPTESDLLSDVRRLAGFSSRHSVLVDAAKKSLHHFKGRQVLDVAEYALEIAETVRSNAESTNADIVRRVKKRRDSQISSEGDVMVIHRPASALIQAISTGRYPQCKRKHHANDKQLFYAMGMMLLAEGLKRAPGDGQRELLLLDAAECVYGLQHLKSLGLGGTRSEWIDALKAAWPEIRKMHGADISADKLRQVLKGWHPDISLPVSRSFDNVVSTLPGRAGRKKPD